MRKSLLAFCVLSCVSFWLFGLISWTSTYDTDTPLGSDAPSVIDDEIRGVKDSIQERQNVDHYWPLTGSKVSDADAGKHRQVTFQAPLAADPAAVDEDEAQIYTKDVDDKAEIFLIDEDENVIQLTTAGSLHTASLETGGITTSLIADANVTLAKMADNSIDSDQYVDASIDAAHIADANITTAKIEDGAVTAAKLSGEYFGTWTNLNSNSGTLEKDEVYKVGSAGFVCVYATLKTNGMIKGYSGSTNPPTLRISHGAINFIVEGLMLPVKKDHYWKITAQAGWAAIYWLPLGSGSCVKQ